MESDNETDFLAPPTPIVSGRSSAIHNVPFVTTGLLVFTGLVSIILCIIWICAVSGFGLNWSNGTWHFLLMTLFVIFTGIGATAFRIFTFLPRPIAKLIHAGCFILSFIIAAIGLFAIFKFHNDAEIPNMYTLHSWLGITFVVIYGLQLTGGIFSFLLPLIPPSARAAVLPYHRASGIIILIGIAGIAMIGINEKLVFSPADYKKKTAYGIVPNTFGLILFTFALIAVMILIRPEYKREENRRHY